MKSLRIWRPICDQRDKCSKSLPLVFKVRESLRMLFSCLAKLQIMNKNEKFVCVFYSMGYIRYTVVRETLCNRFFHDFRE